MQKLDNPFNLFWIFFKIGMFTFGGGASMLPMMEKEFSRFGYSQKDIFNLFSLGQSLPGVIAINAATLTGYRLNGKGGALLATVGVVLPSYLVITLLLTFFKNIFDHPAWQAVFMGIRMSVVALIFSTVIRFFKQIFHQDKVKMLESLALFILSITLLSLKFNAGLIVLGVLFIAIVYRSLRMILQHPKD